MCVCVTVKIQLTIQVLMSTHHTHPCSVAMLLHLSLMIPTYSASNILNHTIPYYYLLSTKNHHNNAKVITLIGAICVILCSITRFLSCGTIYY